MADNNKKLAIINFEELRELDFAIDRFCQEFDLTLVNRTCRPDRLLMFCEFVGAMGVFHMFIEKTDSKVKFSLEINISTP
jgi:hypothetical protein